MMLWCQMEATTDVSVPELGTSLTGKPRVNAKEVEGFSHHVDEIQMKVDQVSNSENFRIALYIAYLEGINGDACVAQPFSLSFCRLWLREIFPFAGCDVYE